MATTVKCGWCYPSRGRMANSEWEQETLSGEWKGMCKICANRRLRNPWNALLPLRKIDRNNT